MESKTKVKIKSDIEKIITMKTSLKSIIKDDKNSTFTNIINDAAIRTNKIYIHTNMFLRLYILNEYDKDKKVPKITIDTIKMIMKTVRI